MRISGGHISDLNREEPYGRIVSTKNGGSKRRMAERERSLLRYSRDLFLPLSYASQRSFNESEEKQNRPCLCFSFTTWERGCPITQFNILLTFFYYLFSHFIYFKKCFFT